MKIKNLLFLLIIANCLFFTNCDKKDNISTKKTKNSIIIEEKNITIPDIKIDKKESINEPIQKKKIVKSTFDIKLDSLIALFEPKKTKNKEFTNFKEKSNYIEVIE